MRKEEKARGSQIIVKVAATNEKQFIWGARFVKDSKDMVVHMGTVMEQLRPMLRRPEFIGRPQEISSCARRGS